MSNLEISGNFYFKTDVFFPNIMKRLQKILTENFYTNFEYIYVKTIFQLLLQKKTSLWLSIQRIEVSKKPKFWVNIRNLTTFILSLKLAYNGIFLFISFNWIGDKKRVCSSTNHSRIKTVCHLNFLLTSESSFDDFNT